MAWAALEGTWTGTGAASGTVPGTVVAEAKGARSALAQTCDGAIPSPGSQSLGR